MEVIQSIGIATIFFKKDHTHCKITCTTIGNEFVFGREAPMYHNDVYGNSAHDPPPIEKILAINMAQEVAETIPQSTQRII